MDTRSNHNSPKDGSVKRETPSSQAETSGAIDLPHWDRRDRKRRGKRGIYKPLGLLLVVAVLSFITLGALCMACLKNVSGQGVNVVSGNGDGIYFYYNNQADSFMGELSRQMDNLYSYIQMTTEEPNKDNGVDWAETEAWLCEDDIFDSMSAEMSDRILNDLKTRLETLGEYYRFNVTLTVEQGYTQYVGPSSSTTFNINIDSEEYPSNWEEYANRATDSISTNMYEYYDRWTDQTYRVTIEPYNVYQRYDNNPDYLRSILHNDHGFLYRVTLRDGTLLTNLPASEDWNTLAALSRLRFSVNNPPIKTYRQSRSYVTNTAMRSFMDIGVEGEVIIPVRDDIYSSYLMTLLQENDQVDRYLGGLRVWLLTSLIGCAAVLLLGLTTFRHSFLWAVGGLYGLYGKQPLFVKTAMFVSLLVMTVFILGDVGSSWPYYIDFSNASFTAPFIMCCLLLLYILLSVLHIIVIITGGRRVLRNEPDIRWLKTYKANFSETLRTGNRLLIVCMLAASLFMLLLAMLFLMGFALIDEMDVALIIWFCASAGLAAMALILSLIFTYAKTSLLTEDMIGGVYRDHLPESSSGWFGQPLRNLERINDGMRKAVDDAIRSERLKTELITNVSHDLKTPLTSIINYVALLKETPMAQDRTAMEYIDIIDKKTMRLQVLIEDLFEAAKLNSGSTELKPEDVNVADLLKQALGELSEKIEASGVIFLCHYGSERIILRLDGKKMWRVFENLISNILKYAPPASRAYINVEEGIDNVVFTFKNVSNYALDFNADELFERFKRGDASRSTEGSGLGLSIARSIVEQSGGRMCIKTDGDLFKVVIEFPI